MFRKLTVATVLLGAFALVGCASPNMYKEYSDSQVKIEVAKYNAQAAKYAAMAGIAATGDATAKVAAVVAMAMGDMSGGTSSGTQLQAPKDPGETALQWASIIFPTATQIYGISSNKALGLRQSDNATALGLRQSDNQVRITESTNNTMLGFGTLIAPTPIRAETPGFTVNRPQPSP